MKLIFAGTPQNAALALELVAAQHEVVLAITREDAEVGRKRVLTPSPVAQVAEKLGLNVLKTSKIRATEMASIEASGAELALVVAYGAMIPPIALELLPWWNIHFSLLPMWRGATPLQHTILHGTRAGVSLFKLDEGLDTGDLVAQREIELGPNETTAQALPRFTKSGTELFLNSVSAQADFTPQIGAATYAPKLSRKDAKIDFTASADEIHRAVMAFNPEPMAWCEFDGNPVRILDSRSLGSTDWTAGEHSAGKVSLSGERVLVECGGGTQLEIKQIQPAGKNPMTAGDWFRGVNKEVHFA